MNLPIFLASIVFSSLGVGFDNLTTMIFINDLGIEFESNPRLRMVRERWGHKAWLGIEAIIIIVLALIDLQLSLLFLGAVWGMCRCLAATYNFQIISEYRAIGIGAFRENIRRRRQLFQGVSRINRCKMRLQYFVCSVSCFIVFTMVLFIGAYELESPIVLFLTVLVESLVLGMGIFFLRIWMIN